MGPFLPKGAFSSGFSSAFSARLVARLVARSVAPSESLLPCRQNAVKPRNLMASTKARVTRFRGLDNER